MALLYPVHIYEDDTTLPEGEYYVVAGNGIWFRKETAVFVGFVPVPSISSLRDFENDNATIKCVLPKISHEIVMKVKKFFVQVFKKYHSEACVILCLGKDSKYSIVVPRQWNSHKSVKYIRPCLNEELGLSVGTIHSHCDFGAFHSSTDHEDESTFDGLHITFGDIAKSAGMSVTASLVVNNMRCLVDPLIYLDGVIKSNQPNILYKIIPPEGEIDYNAWTAEVDSWVGKVNIDDPPSPWNEEGIIAWRQQYGNQEN